MMMMESIAQEFAPPGHTRQQHRAGRHSHPDQTRRNGRPRKPMTADEATFPIGA